MDGHRPKGRLRTWCGLQKKVFWTLVIIVVVVVIGAIVGGAVGGALAHKSEQDASEQEKEHTVESRRSEGRFLQLNSLA